MEKTSAYILSIVGIVGLVAVAVLLMNGVDYNSSNDLSGQVISVNKSSLCGDGTCARPETPRTCPTDCRTRDADGDGVSDAKDACPGYDDHVDTDSDGTPDGCDTDDDGDGYSDADETAAGTDPLDATDYPADLPDLVVSGINSVKINQTNGNISINYTLENQGTGDVSEYYVLLNLDASYTDTTGTGKTTSETAIFFLNNPTSVLARGSINTMNVYTAPVISSDVVATIASGSPYALEIVVEVDTNSHVAESDETNNEYTTTVTLTSANLIS